MEFAVGPDGEDTLEIHCADFRHGRVWTFEGIALEVEVTAANQRGGMRRTFVPGFEMKCVNVKDLINLEDRDYVVAFPMMKKKFEEALEARDKDWIELSEDDEDED